MSQKNLQLGLPTTGDFKGQKEEMLILTITKNGLKGCSRLQIFSVIIWVRISSPFSVLRPTDFTLTKTVLRPVLLDQ